MPGSCYDWIWERTLQWAFGHSNELLLCTNPRSCCWLPKDLLLLLLLFGGSLAFLAYFFLQGIVFGGYRHVTKCGKRNDIVNTQGWCWVFWRPFVSKFMLWVNSIDWWQSCLIPIRIGCQTKQARLLNGVFFFLNTKQNNKQTLASALPCSSIHHPNAIVFLLCMVMCVWNGSCRAYSTQEFDAPGRVLAILF